MEAYPLRARRRQGGNIGPHAEAVEESAEGISGLGYKVPHKVKETKKKNECAEGVSSLGNGAPRGVKKTSTRAEVSSNTSRVDSKVSHSEFKTPPQRPAEDQYHTFEGVSSRQVRAVPSIWRVSALLNLEERFMNQNRRFREVVLLKPEASPEDLDFSSVMDEMFSRRATRWGSDIFKNPKGPVYPLVEEFSDVVSKHPPSQLQPDRGVRHEIDLVTGASTVSRRSGLYSVNRAIEIPHTTPDLLRPEIDWEVMSWSCLQQAEQCDGTGTAADPSQGRVFEQYAGLALDLVKGYYRILMWESDIPLTAVTTTIGMLWECIVMPQRLSNTPATFDRLTLGHVRADVHQPAAANGEGLLFLAEYNLRVEYKPSKLD
ncbi:LOW QUALITY PROTEIN: Pol protein, partial [Phytophthora palmivora]